MTEHKNLAAALVAFQAALPHVPKATTGNRGKYADLADLSPIILPKLAEHGMSWSCLPRINEHGQFVLAYKLRHVSGDVDEGEWPLPDPATGSQAMGSACTYARRYCLGAVTGVAPAGDDDDGERSRETSHRAQPPAQRRNTTSPAGQPPQGAQQEAHLVAKAKLRKACADSGWDMHKVADLFAGQHQAELGETTNAAVIDAFTASLYALSDADLKAPAKASA
jgi:hypothetical protein